MYGSKFLSLAMAADITSCSMMSTRTAVYIFPVWSSDRHSWSKFTQAYQVKCLKKNPQGNDSSSVVDQDWKMVLRMSEKHGSEGNMDDNKECVESITPVVKGMVASGWEDQVSITEECYSERIINVAATGMRPQHSHSLAKSSLILMQDKVCTISGHNVTRKCCLLAAETLLVDGERLAFMNREHNCPLVQIGIWYTTQLLSYGCKQAFKKSLVNVMWAEQWRKVLTNRHEVMWARSSNIKANHDKLSWQQRKKDQGYLG